MGRGKRSRIRRQGSFEIDLLTTAFGLPSRIMIQRAEEKAPKVMVHYSRRDKDHDDDGTDSSFSCFDEDDDFSVVSEVEVVKTPSPPTPPRKSKSTVFRLKRPKKHQSRVRSPTPPRRSRRSASSKRSPPRPSPRVSPRYSPRSSPKSSPESSERSSSSSFRELSNQSAPLRAVPAPVATFVQPSASFPQTLPVSVLSGTTAVSTNSPNSFNSAFQSSPLPFQRHYYYHPQFAFIQPTSKSAPIPQTLAPSHATPNGSYSGPPSHAIPAIPHAYMHSDESPGWAAASGRYAQDLQRIQKDIDLQMAYLAHHPDNAMLRNEVRRLQDLLNATLNAAIAKDGNPKDQETLSYLREPMQTVQEPEATEKEEPLNSITSSTREDQLSAKPISPSSPRHPSPPPIPVESISEGPSPEVNHHLCSGCGCIRSKRFHRKHPFSLQQKLVVNFCRICRDKKIHRGVVGRYHFCFDCGQVRSKAFQREHTILPGDPILANYCGPCMKEMRPNEGILDASLLGVDTESLFYRSGIPSPSASDGDSLTAHLNRGSRRQQLSNDFDTFTPSPIQSEDEEITRPQLSSQTVSGETKHRRRPEPLNLEKAMPVHTQLESAKPSPFLPTRSLGSAERRAQRNPLRLAEDQVDSPRDFENYRAPYVEDSSSAPHSRKTSPPSSILSHALDGTTELGLRSRSARQQSSKHASKVSEEDRRTASSSSKSRDESCESEISFDSTRNSSGSSGSKTVRFKSSVDIRSSAVLNDENTNDDARVSSRTDRNSSRRGNSPLVFSEKRSESRGPHSFMQEGDQVDYLESGHGFSVRQQYQVGRGSPDHRTSSPGFSNGAFSKNFEIGSDDWGRAEPHIESSRRQSPGFGSSFGAYFAHKSKGNGDGFGRTVDMQRSQADKEVSTPLSAVRQSTEGFSSFFSKSNGSTSKISCKSQMTSPVPPSPRDHDSQKLATDHLEGLGSNYSNVHRESRSSTKDFDPYSTSAFGSCANFTDMDHTYPGEDESFLQSEYSVPKSENPYYNSKQRRAYRFDTSGYHSDPGRTSKKSWKPKKWSPPTDYNPEPIIEEASSVCSSHDTDIGTRMLEYNVVFTDSSSEAEEDDEPEIEELPSNYDMNENVLLTEINAY